MKRFLLTVLFSIFVMAIWAPLASAATVVGAPDPLSGVPIWVMLLGAVTPLLTYVLNHYAPWASERVKAVAHVVVAALVGALYKLASTDSVDFSHQATWKYMAGAVAAALFAHKVLYAPGTINTLFKGGSNAHKK